MKPAETTAQRRTGSLFLVLVALWPLRPAQAEGEPTEVGALSSVVVIGRSTELIGAARSAAEGVVEAQQLSHRPLLRPAEVMETVPGLIVTQHSGDGKANQYFLRGFNLDHGSDFASFINGMPVNMVSHAHGQGYMDLNFLIPELVGSMRYSKGVYAAEDGDFATTGSARISYVRDVPVPLVEISLGAGAYRRAYAVGSTELGGLALLGALELGGNDGPWQQREGLHKQSTVLRLSKGSPRHGWSVTAMSYSARWTATEHVPERVILAGEIGRYGQLAPGDGGRTHRRSLSGEWVGRSEGTSLHVSAYLIDYGLNLFSNPTGYVSGPLGDQHEQADRRTVWGGHLARKQQLDVVGLDTELTLGAQWRQDRIATLGLYDTAARQRTATVREDRVQETQIGLYGEARTPWRPWLRSVLGLRFDELRGRVTPLAGTFNAANGGTVVGHQFSPRLGLVFGPFGSLAQPYRTEVFVNWGKGFHSNDLRGVTSAVNSRDGSTIGRVPPLVQATSRELGLRVQPLDDWTSSLSLWRMELASELVYVGDEGVTQPRGASRRAGVEWSNDWRLGRSLVLDADLAWSRARFQQAVNGGMQIPNAIPLSASFALIADDQGPWFGALRWRYVGAYPLEESGMQRSRASWTTNLRLGWRATRDFEFRLDLLNLFDREANDIEYWGASCSRGDGPGCGGGAGLEGRLIHPMEPRTLRLALRANF